MDGPEYLWYGSISQHSCYSYNMRPIVQIFEASIRILEFLYSKYEHGAESYDGHCYPDHLIRLIAGVEDAALLKPASILDRIIFYDLYVVDVFRILSSYPEAMMAMCTYKEIDGSVTIDMLRCHAGYEYILCTSLRPFEERLGLR